MTILIQGGSLLTDDGQTKAADIRIDDGWVTEISAQPLEQAPGEEVINAVDQLIMPGMINAHAHSPLSVTKGTTDRMNHPTFMWTNQRDTAWRSAEEIEAATTLAAADMLRHGITGVIDHVPEQNASIEGIEPIERAWRQSGMRAAMALRIFDGRYDDIGEQPANIQGTPLQARSSSELLAMCEQAIETMHRPDEGIQIFIGPSNSERCSDELLAGAHELAVKHQTGFHAHLLETRIQRESCLARHGLTPVGRLHRLGALSARCSFAHCVWADQGDIELFARTGAVPIHNPHSNAKLGVGLMPLPAMLDAGCEVALGTDGASTNDTLNMHECMALALLLQRPGNRQPDQWQDARTAIRMATAGGAQAMGLSAEIGAIGVGKRADLTFYDLNSLDLCPANDLAEQWVFAERGRSLRRTMVAGRSVYVDGDYPTLDLVEAMRIAVAMRAKVG